MFNKKRSAKKSKEASQILDNAISEDNISTSSEKSKSKFSLLKKNLKKNFKMSSKEKSLENVNEITTGKKKKSKKNKDKSKIQPKEPQLTEQEPSTSEKRNKGSVVRRLSLDKLYSNIKGSSKSKEDSLKGRRSTTPDISSGAMSLREELQQAESKLEGLADPKKQIEAGLEESEQSEDYRTPACQSPVGSYIYDAVSQTIHDPTPESTRDNLSEMFWTNDKKTEFFSSSEPSLESAIQSGTTTPLSDGDQKYKTEESFFSKDITYASILNKFGEGSSSIKEKESEIGSKNVAALKDQSDLQIADTSPLNSAQGTTGTAPNTNNLSSQSENLSVKSKISENEENVVIPSSKNAPEEATESQKVVSDSIIVDKSPDKFHEKDPAFAEPSLIRRKSFLPTEPENQASSEKKECLFKILVIGELGTGKTSIIKRYVHEFFSQHYRATIGVDFALKVLNWDQDTVIRLQLWDIAGQERFGNMTRVYYKEAVGAFIVFDVTRSATFDAVLKWKQDLDSKVQLSNGSPIPCVLLANKCDQAKEGPVNHPEKIEQFCRENNFSDWFETSAKENINIDQAAKSLVTKILQNDKLSQNGKESARDTSKFPLDSKDNQSSGEKSCAC